MEKVRGYKVFNHDWTCRGKQYSCPGKFEEDVMVSVCNAGMHFCKKASDCFNYYKFDSNNKVAEVIAYGSVAEKEDKCCTDKLEIVREIPWYELLSIVNTGNNCTGLCNTGDYNTGNSNTGDRNTGDYNTGNDNTGDYNTGNRNTGDYNTGDYNTGDWNISDRNTGNYNTGNRNTGNYNTGNRNTGNYNTGNSNTGYYNTGNYNTGYYNTGNYNTGNYNTGDCNTGDYNTGDWNISCFNNGCFNTTQATIFFFNKPSAWTYQNWITSRAKSLLISIPRTTVEWVFSNEMTDKEKSDHPSYKTTGGYLKTLDKKDSAVKWWKNLRNEDKSIIMQIPNFDKEIFKEITGIDVDS